MSTYKIGDVVRVIATGPSYEGDHAFSTGSLLWVTAVEDGLLDCTSMHPDYRGRGWWLQESEVEAT